MSRLAHVSDDTRRRGLAAILAIDDGVGKIRAFLRSNGIDRQTILIFISDNGAPTRGEVWNGSFNAPLVGEKGMLRMEGSASPSLRRGQAYFPLGAVESRAVSALDIAATILAAAHARSSQVLDGIDLTPFLTGRMVGQPHEFLYWRWRSQSAVFDGRWKLLRLPPDRYFLFDHAAEAAETVDVSSQHPDVVARLRVRLEAWAGELVPPGLPEQLTPNDGALYDDHLPFFPQQPPRRSSGKVRNPARD